jgi:hypothetical protein
VDLAEYSRIWQIAVDCHRIAVRLPSCGRSLIAKSVETGGRVQGVTGVSRDTVFGSNYSTDLRYVNTYYVYKLCLYNINSSVVLFKRFA